jgi:hypothetical protein
MLAAQGAKVVIVDLDKAAGEVIRFDGARRIQPK